jgi:hypothetical protein
MAYKTSKNNKNPQDAETSQKSAMEMGSSNISNNTASGRLLTTSALASANGTNLPDPVLELDRSGIKKLFSDSNTVTMDGLTELMLKGYMPQLSGKLTLESKCEHLISEVGFTLVSGDEISPGLKNMKNFSLVGSENIDETIMNSKIMDPDISKLTPVKIEAIEKIKSENDPFYELDQERSESIKLIVHKEKRKDRKKAVRIAKQLTSIVRKAPNKMLEKEFDRSQVE